MRFLVNSILVNNRPTILAPSTPLAERDAVFGLEGDHFSILLLQALRKLVRFVRPTCLPLRIPILLRLVHSHETRNERRGTPLFRSRNNSSSLRFQSIQEINDLNFVENLSRILSRTRKKKELHKPGDGILENKRRNNRRGEEDGREVTCSTLSIHSRKGKYRDPVIRDKAAKRC